MVKLSLSAYLLNRMLMNYLRWVISAFKLQGDRRIGKEYSPSCYYSCLLDVGWQDRNTTHFLFRHLHPDFNRETWVQWGLVLFFHVTTWIKERKWLLMWEDSVQPQTDGAWINWGQASHFLMLQVRLLEATPQKVLGKLNIRFSYFEFPCLLFPHALPHYAMV